MIAQNVKDLFPNDLQQITYIGELPTDADVCISLIESGGPHGTYFAKDEMNTPYLKVMVRDPSYPDGYATVSAVKDLITSFADARLLGIVLRGDIDYLGRDDKRRNIFQLNYRIFEYRKNINTTSIGTSVYVKGEFVSEFDADTKLDKVTSSGAYARLYNIKPDGTQDTVSFTTSAIAYTVVQRDGNGDVVVPVDPSSQNSAASKNYIDAFFVQKRNNADGLYHVYAFTDTQLDLAVDIGRSAYSLALRDGKGEVSTNEPTAPTSAANKQYVDGLIDKAWVCCVKTPSCAYSVYNFTLPQKLYSDTRCYIPDDVSENTVVSNMQLTFAKGETPTVIVCKVVYFDKTDNTFHKVSYNLEKLDSAEAVENYTGNNCAYFIY